MLKKYQIIDDDTLERFFKEVGMPKGLYKILEELSVKKKLRKDEDYDDIQYIDLVYPPGSNPPIRNSIKKMTLIGLNQISRQAYF
jgi:hypothetical protein